MNNKPLSLQGVSHSFGGLEVLRDIRLEIKRDEIVALIGPSGCGKTTLLNLLSGFYEPTVGAVVRSGATRMIHQQGGLLPWLTASENIALGLRQLTDAREIERQLEELLELIQLSGFADHYPHQLSGGMRQRVELARAMAGHTDVLLLDEPFSSLDYQTRLKMRYEFLRILAARPRTVVLVTHDIEEAVHVADRVVVLSSQPARVCDEIPLNLKHPRSTTHPLLLNAMTRILGLLDLRRVASTPSAAGMDGRAARRKTIKAIV